jgi:hypothetical protein
MKRILLLALLLAPLGAQGQEGFTCPAGYWTGSGYCILPPEGSTCIASGSYWVGGECKESAGESSEPTLPNEQYDAELMQIGFSGAVLCWVTGFGVGLVLSMVRKLRAA